MITLDKFLGNAKETALSGNTTLKRNSNRVQTFWPTSGTARDVTLPKATQLDLGGPTFIIQNEGLGNVVVKDYGGSTLVTLGIAESAILNLIDNSNNDGVWSHVDKAGIKLATVHDLPMDLNYFSSIASYQALQASVEVVNDRLILHGEDNGYGYVAVGNPTGAFLPCRGAGSIECCVTEVDTSYNLNGIGFCVLPYASIAAGLQYFGLAGTAGVVVYYYTTGGGQQRVSGITGAGYTSTALSSTLPSENNPFWLKYTWSISGANAVGTASYRIGDSGGYTQIRTDTWAIPASWSYKFDVGPVLVAAQAGAVRFGTIKRLIYRSTK